MSRHLSADDLALYLEGVLSSRKQARIGSHLSGCRRCDAIRSELTAVPGLLARTSAPSIPDRLAERIQLALASEAAARSRVAADLGTGLAGESRRTARRPENQSRPGSVPGRPDLPDRASRRSRQPWTARLASPVVLRALAATGAVVVIAGAGFLLANRQSPSTQSGAAARPLPSAMAPNRAAAGAVSRVPISYRRGGNTVTTTALATSTDYTRQSLGRLAVQRLRKSAPYLETAGPSGAAGAKTVQIAGVSVGQLGACLTQVAADRTVLIADVAHYLGRPAIIIVMRALTGANLLDVTVVSVACSATAAHVIISLQVHGS